MRTTTTSDGGPDGQERLPPAFGRMMTNGQLVDVLPVGIYFCDRSGAILRFNRAAEELWGRVPVNGADERFCGSFRLYRPDGEPLPHEQSPMASVLRTGQSARDEEVVIERPDGSRVTVLANIEPVLDEEGELVGAANCFRDISELQRSRDALEAERHRLHALLDALPAAIYTTDAAGRITFYNQAAIELVGRRPELDKAEWCVSLRLYAPDGQPMPHDECPMAVALKQRREIRGAEAVAERPDGWRVPFLAYPTPLFDSSGRLTGA
ncbi:MAG: PAS domain-containing protein, partial [Geminicoccaceae bacterium]|nr:PAS domain-containing protein [Geminicoccaceae bacterium]